MGHTPANHFTFAAKNRVIGQGGCTPDFTVKYIYLLNGMSFLQEQYMFLYDVLVEAIRCSKIQPTPMDQLQRRTSMYKYKKTRQEVETKDIDEYKVRHAHVPGNRNKLMTYREFQSKMR